jgi:hypothetical protein
LLSLEIKGLAVVKVEPAPSYSGALAIALSVKEDCQVKARVDPGEEGALQDAFLLDKDGPAAPEDINWRPIQGA